MTSLSTCDVWRKEVSATPPDQLFGDGAVLSGSRGIDIFDSILAVDDEDVVLRGFREDAIVVAEMCLLVRAHWECRLASGYLIA